MTGTSEEVAPCQQQRGGVTAHIARVTQDQEQITTLVMSEVQVLEFISLLTTGLREKAVHRDGYHLAIWKDIAVQKCQANPACEGGAGMVNLVRPEHLSTEVPTVKDMEASDRPV